jgi:transposase-like protein
MKLTQTDRREIVAAIKSGKVTYLELGRKYSILPTRIGQIYRKETGTLFRPIKRLSQSDKETIVSEIQAKKATMSQLAERYGVRQSRVSAVFKEMTGSALFPRKTEEKHESLPAPITENDTNAIPFTDVLETVVRLNRENPQYQFTLEIKLKEQVVTIQLEP